ncbi:MAG TPA: hypothetical protein V6D22_03630 [Candidatus Obscuribacterales bacterium]
MADVPVSQWLKNEVTMFDAASESSFRGTNHEALGAALHNEYCQLNEDRRKELIGGLLARNTHEYANDQWKDLTNGDGQRLGVMQPYRLFLDTNCQKK